ncbi:MAG: methyltransferase domain-containing protein [Actinomycetia bacterium]|nr:methyltransferase domain-containing protein [Actinomycetes bacterium]
MDAIRDPGFATVDAAADPALLVGYLDRTACRLAGLKERVIELLAPACGHAVLDVGCGTGDDVRAMAGFVGPAGRVVGLDTSITMVAEARRRAAGLGLPVAFGVGDAHALPFAAASFDACRADRVLQHLARPRHAAAEMARVLRPGGRVVVCEPDWRRLVVEHPDPVLTGRLLGFRAAGLAAPSVGGRLGRLLRAAGLAQVSVTAVPVALGGPHLVDGLRLETTVRDAVRAGVVTAAQGSRWLADLVRAGAAGRGATLTMLLAAATDAGAGHVVSPETRPPGARSVAAGRALRRRS